MAHTNIEYAEGGYGWNFLPGCRHGADICPVSAHCWARGMAKRYKKDFEPHLIPELLLAPLRVKKPSTILVNFMGELGGDWVDPEQIVHPECVENPKGYRFLFPWPLARLVQHIIALCSQHRFLFLSKSPENWAKWGKFPDNAWVGASACNPEMFMEACEALSKTSAKNKWLSIEPLLERIGGGECEGLRLDGIKEAGISWVVIGRQDKPTIWPEIEWVKEIVEACDRAGVKVWLKNNMLPLFEEKRGKTFVQYRQGVDMDLFFPIIPNRPNLRKDRQETPWGGIKCSK